MTYKDKVSVYFSNECTREQKQVTASFLTSVEYRQISVSDETIGFSFQIDNFNKAISNRRAIKIEKTNMATQTDWKNIKEGSPSPSGFSVKLREQK